MLVMGWLLKSGSFWCADEVARQEAETEQKATCDAQGQSGNLSIRPDPPSLPGPSHAAEVLSCCLVPLSCVQMGL